MQRSDDDYVREQEQAAAEEARRIGGNPGDLDEDPKQRPVREAGGGEAEGFEDAEEELIEHAELSSGEGMPRLDDFDEEAEPDPATYGEADEEDVTETVRDPDEGPGDPGAGPGISADR